MKVFEKEIQHYPNDIYFYYGSVSRFGYEQLCQRIQEKLEKSRNACLILTTPGGDPDAAFRMSRALGNHYEKLEILVPGICKSAGTLMCVGADRLIFGDLGELGPLDIQISKPEEILENMSGLNSLHAIGRIQNAALDAFRQYIAELRGSGVKTRVAAEIATNLVETFVSPIAQKIDPLVIAEHQRAMQIGMDYGVRLNERANNLRNPQALKRLITEYPSHSFVIDRKEARSLFNNVDAPNLEEIPLYYWSRVVIEENIMPSDHEPPIVIDVKKYINGSIDPKEVTKDENENGGNDSEPSANVSRIDAEPNGKSEAGK